MNNITLRGELSVFAARVIMQCLSSDIVTRQWIENSDIDDSNSYLCVLVLRMIMIVCVMKLNGEFPKNALAQMLDKRNITSHLPKEFYKALKSKKQRSQSSSVVSTIASAFKVIGDPLVLVMSTNNALQLACPNVFIVQLRSFSCKTDMMKTLFPQSTEASKDQPTSVDPHEATVVISRESSKKKKKAQKREKRSKEVANILPTSSIS
ncbi:hypothetical protein C2S53_010916 [Perilla frutescens var. hirtella]|uniref:Uncharacterized protein n=1 Tax=Perilla frutescens var. hirtella TaxID=608512 RepID=A0AAD4J0Z3_PERFH|nr:hypothetical protein C2S53_010916 [Perilla frutescens var. hirtella]